MRFLKLLLLSFAVGCGGLPVATPPLPMFPQAKDYGAVRVSGGVIAGQLLNHVMPVVPSISRETRQNGTVVLHVLIGADGLVKEIAAVSGPAFLLKPCMDAARQWTYRPYLLHSIPTAVDTVVMINIQLNGS